MNIKYRTSNYLDSESFAEKRSDDDFVRKLFLDCLGEEPGDQALSLRRIMLKTGFPRSRMRHDILTTAAFRSKLKNLPFWLYYDLFIREFLSPSQEAFLEKVKSLGMEDKTILEVGCSYGDICKALAREPIRKIIGIDLVLTEDFYFDQLDTPISKDRFHHGEVITKRYELRQIDIRDTHFDSESFDLIISDATFEHIEDLPRALAEMRRIMKPGGLLYARWAPIWSAVDGHHLYHWFKHVKVYGNRGYDPLEIPAWGHLRMSEQEMHDFISKKKGEAVASFGCHRIFHSGFLNRMMPDDYVSAIRRSGLHVRSLERLWGPEPSKEIMDELGQYRGEDLRTSGLEILLEK